MKRILVVEDEPGIALGLEDDLSMEGYEVEVVADGLAGSRRALLRRAGGDVGAECYRFGDVEADFERGELRRKGRVIELTPIEFKLLAVFVRSRGRILTREQLLAGAWGPDTFASDRIVDSHIANLRRKIEPDHAKPRYLRNLRGLGYRFDG